MYLIFWLAVTFALDPATNAVDHAQALARKKDRRAAAQVLIAALVDLPATNKAAHARIAEALNQITRVFFTDKGQRAFESGQAMMFDNPDVAINQFRDALVTEDDNLAVLEDLTKVYLFKNDCASAAATLIKARALNPLGKEALLLDLRILVCQKVVPFPAEKVRALPPLDKWEEAFVNYLQAKTLLDEAAPKKAFDLLARVNETQPKFPEAYYWASRAAAELSKDPEPALRHYVKICKSITPKERRRFSLEPRLCAHQKEAEDELAKRSNDG